MRGKFITFEGTDGAGKTTALKQVLKILRPILGSKLVLSREPGGNPIAEQIRQIILDPKNYEMDPRTEAFLYAASRRQNLVQTILPALRDGKFVLCDRFEDSSIAYQGGGRRLGYAPIIKLNRYATDGIQPDLTIYFQVSAQIGLQRIKTHRQNDIDRLDREHLSFYRRVNRMYRKINRKNPRRVKVVNADQSKQEVVKNVLTILKRDAGISL